MNVASIFEEILENFNVSFVASVMHTCETVLLLSVDLVGIVLVFVLALLNYVAKNLQVLCQHCHVHRRDSSRVFNQVKTIIKKNGEHFLLATEHGSVYSILFHVVETLALDASCIQKHHHHLLAK